MNALYPPRLWSDEEREAIDERLAENSRKQMEGWRKADEEKEAQERLGCAIVRRGKRPGCKFDHAMVLEGDEGLGKSRAVEALVSGIGKEYYSDMGILAVSDKERQELTRGILVYELGELKGIRKAEAEDVKQFLVRVDDRGRRAYGKYVKTQLRTCVFIGTTNDQEYLVSQTGNRRWWPVECTGIDVDGLVEDIDQLLAEAVLAEPDEELFIPVELWPEAKALQDSRRYKHVWEELLVGLEETQHVKKMEGEAGPELRIHTATVLSQVLGIPASSVNDNTNKTLSSIMQRLGWKKSTKTIRIGKKSAMGYVKPIPLISAPSPAPTAPLLPAPPFSGQRIRRL